MMIVSVIKKKRKRGELTFKERLLKLQDKRMAIIFDECHRSQFGDNHEAIKTFFPKAQLFGFTGTPIFEENSNYKQVDGTIGSYKTTKDVFEKNFILTPSQMRLMMATFYVFTLIILSLMILILQQKQIQR